MIQACVKEANRIYKLWCANNPGFSEIGRVHIMAHSLGSVMAVDILSQQPTFVKDQEAFRTSSELKSADSHFDFDTSSLFLCGSPVGFFLFLKGVTLLPRRGRKSVDFGNDASADMVSEERTYGCLAVDNIYNIVNPYDPVAYCLNAAVDNVYAASIKTGLVPPAGASWMSLANPFRKSNSLDQSRSVSSKPNVPRFPSNVELETHNFSREEIAESRAYLLNDNGQIDWFLRYGGGALEIQYLTMLGAHSSYWISKDFIKMVVLEIGRKPGREGTLSSMKAQKKKTAAP